MVPAVHLPDGERALAVYLRARRLPRRADGHVAGVRLLELHVLEAVLEAIV